MNRVRRKNRAMVADDLFGKTLERSCGRRHHIEPRRVVYAADAGGSRAAVARSDGRIGVP